MEALAAFHVFAEEMSSFQTDGIHEILKMWCHSCAEHLRVYSHFCRVEILHKELDGIATCPEALTHGVEGWYQQDVMPKHTWIEMRRDA